MARNHLSFTAILFAFGGILTSIALASHQPAGGGDDCASATPITVLPFSDTGTTIGFADDYAPAPSCAFSSAPDVVYHYAPVWDVSVDISLCGSSYDTVLYVYEGACEGPIIACDDDTCGRQSMVENVPLSGGTSYYIVVDGWSTSAGDYVINVTASGASPGLGCPTDALFGQSTHAPAAGGSLMVTDSERDYLLYEGFWGFSGSIGRVCWWGFQLSCGAQWCSDCTRSPDGVTVTFYHDDGGSPGAPACGPYSALSPTVTDTGLVYGGWRLYEFSVDVSPTCVLSSGWVSIQGTGGDSDCWLCWLTSPDGDGLSYLGYSGYMVPRDMDLSLCLMGQPIADEDGDGVPDDLDVCPGFSDHSDADDDGVPNGCDLCPQTPRGVPVDADGCMVFDDGGDDDDDGVSNKCDICPHTPACAVVNAVGCPIDSDGDGVYDGCDLCPGSSRYAVVDANGCAITDAKQAAPVERWPSCCGMAGPVAPLGLAVGMLLLSRVSVTRNKARRR